jgi:small-conductance mechanosensitive channel
MTLGDVIFTISDQEFTLGQLLIIPTVLIVGYLAISWLARIITRRLVAHNTQPDIVHLIRRVFYIVALAVLAITTLDLLNVPLTAFAFVSGAIAIGVGFGAQNIINNFISGWILMWERPIRIGDYLEVGAPMACTC